MSKKPTDTAMTVNFALGLGGDGTRVPLAVAPGARVLIYESHRCDSGTFHEDILRALDLDAVDVGTPTKRGELMLHRGGKFYLMRLSPDKRGVARLVFSNVGRYLDPNSPTVYDGTNRKYHRNEIRAVIASSPEETVEFAKLLKEHQDTLKQARLAEEKENRERKASAKRTRLQHFRLNADRWLKAKSIREKDGVSVVYLQGGFIRAEIKEPIGEFEIIRYADVAVAKARLKARGGRCERDLPDKGMCANHTVFNADGSTMTEHAIADTLEEALGAVWANHGQRVY